MTSSSDWHNHVFLVGANLMAAKTIDSKQELKRQTSCKPFNYITDDLLAFSHKKKALNTKHLDFSSSFISERHSKRLAITTVTSNVRYMTLMTHTLGTGLSFAVVIQSEARVGTERGMNKYTISSLLSTWASIHLSISPQQSMLVKPRQNRTKQSSN